MISTSCKSDEKSNTQSGLKGGHLIAATGLKTNWLINIPPNSSVSICGVANSVLKNAFEVWAAGAGRVAPLLKTTLQHCDQATSIKVWGRKALATEKSCIDGAAAFAEPDKRQISFCPPYHLQTTTETFKYIALHEMGHLFGMCDQYVGSTPASDNCDINHKSPNLNPISVMSAFSGNYTQLQTDDKKWLKKLSTRPDIPANIAWAKLLTNENTVSSEKPDIFGVTVIKNPLGLGVKIVNISPNSKASNSVFAEIDGQSIRGGLSVNDIITEIFGVKINSENEFARVFDSARSKYMHFKVLDSKNGFSPIEAYVVLN